MPTPSLLIVPARFKSGKMYSQIPTSGDGDFNVTRATTATRFGPDGLIASVPSGIPRLDYFASGGVVGCPALLVEPSAKNEALRSEEFNVSGTWSISNSSQISANVSATLDPAGGNNADLIFCQASGTAAQGLNQSISLSVSGTYTMSVFVKKAINFDWFRIQFQDPASAVHQVYYNLVSGTLGNVSAGSTGTITNYGNGWYRITHTRSTASGTVGFGVRLASADNVLTVTCDGNSGSYVWGAQVETGSVATSYIPTTTAAVTRNADVVSVSGAVSGSIGQTEGTIYAEVDLKNKGISVSRIIYLSDGTSNNEIRISHSVATAGDLQIAIRIAGSLVINQTSPTAVYFGINKIAVGYKVGTNEVAMYVNGSQIVLTTSTGNMPACNTIHLGSQLGSSNFLNDRIRAVALYTTRLTNAELAALTAP